ncbi:hypothetical protein NL506_26670, partial [Klebsiella pneumoniae]|nr:hypothetical protein [Klebsiella pneumoniae]
DGTTTSTSSSTDNNDWVWYKWSGYTRVSGNSGQRTWRGSNENCVAPTNTYRESWKGDPPKIESNGYRSQFSTVTANGSTFSASFANGVCTIS